MWGFLGGLAGAAGSLFGGMRQEKSARQQFEYGKWAQQQEWQRQDSQLQRMVGDARAAGISPLAALGQANYAQPTQTPSGTAVNPYGNAASHLAEGLSRIRTKQEVENASLQNDLLRAQIQQVNAATRGDVISQMAATAQGHTVANGANYRQDGKPVNLTPTQNVWGYDVTGISADTPDIFQLPVPGIILAANAATNLAMRGYDEYVRNVATPLDTFVKTQGGRVLPDMPKKGQAPRVGRRAAKKQSLRR